MKLYTKSGDAGTTALWAGARTCKGSDRIESIGLVDALDAQIGMALALGPTGSLVTQLEQVQNDLYVAGCDLMAPEMTGTSAKVPRMDADSVARLEDWIDQLTDATPPLKNFIHPGGTPAAAALHVARTSCRTAERQGHRLAANEAVNQYLLQYLNRLADYLFAAARFDNHEKACDERLASN